MSPKLVGLLLGWSECHAVQRQPGGCTVNLPSKYDPWVPPFPTVSTHHGIEVSVGLATGRDHSVMTGLDEALSLIL